MKEHLTSFNMVYNIRIQHFGDSFNYKWVYSICFLPDFSNILGKVVGWVGHIFDDASSNDLNSWTIVVFLTRFILFGRFRGTSINYVWIKNPTIIGCFFGYFKRPPLLTMERRSVNAILCPAKKSFFSTFKIWCRFDFSPNSQSHTDQNFEIKVKLPHCSIASKFCYKVIFRRINLTWNYQCYKILPYRGVSQVKKLCDALAPCNWARAKFPEH